jgi:hypothetical protein
MSKEKLLEKLRHCPETLIPTCEMNEPNQVVKIFNGDYVIKVDDNEIEITGNIQFEWFPNMGTYFYGNPKTDSKTLYELSDKELRIFVDDLEIGSGFILTTNFGTFNGNESVEGTLSNKVLIGDKSVAVDQIRFCIPNLREFYGGVTKKVTEEKISSYRNRIVLSFNSYEITIDKLPEYKELRKKLNVKGGYLVFYSGQLTKQGKPIHYNELQDIFHCFNTFLWFLNGRRSSALFIQGLFKDNLIWTDYSHYTVDIFKSVQSWPSRGPTENFDSIWKNFTELWKDDDNKNFLTSSIHWYLESNGYTGYSEGSLIMAQTALELIYNWWIIERKKIIAGKDSENICASNKIRLLLSQLDISYLIPEAFEDLKKYADDSQEIIDGPEAIVQIRNAIVHSQQEKRRKLTSIGTMAKYQALQLSIWYVEMALLKILDYNGKYFNRCSKAKWASQAEEFVPWYKDEKI